MNRLSISERSRVVAALVEGNSIRSTSRMTGVARNTVTSLLLDMAEACAAHHDRYIRNVRVRRLQCDEIWAFVGAKKKNVTPEQEQAGWGDIWTWTAIDADTKLCVAYYVGDRGKYSAYNFMSDCANRILGRPQITTDAHRPYLQAIEDAFGTEVDYAQLHKIFGAATPDESRYSPATCIGCDMKTVMGDPDPKHVSTSFVERQNLSMRMSIRRFTRLTNAFSKKAENHAASVVLWFAYYNFCRIHQTLRVTPAMEAGISEHVWSLEELVGLLDGTKVASS
ncbi:MAG: IS1 family transposase [Formivibrio sp.]|nr:IS1 family transposase [Formivibrio sp.]